ncbi:hypothetical protein TSOC_012472 [Tetrabaena socialis]|uniref:SET domain-containing protein n=1 Tax=Tetrabaena socialis TaxID=47790 RepID=A0A2J7ZMY4_9CHLO|nr:hypothetical protein TSOC_012472 [Tetrabaena socialis]|eukprot:PNH01628.1 hypothetical protein TSOC_012472 [Tetrabaena socialis]
MRLPGALSELLSPPPDVAGLEPAAAPAGGPSSAQAPAGGRTPDPRRLVALAAALTVLGEAVFAWLSSQPALPPVEEVAGALAAGAALVAGGVPAGLAAAKVLMGDMFHVELHRGRLYVCAGVPSRGPPLAPGSVAVRPTGDARGNGAFASVRIPAGTHIADYSGELLDRAAFAERYPDGVGDYAMAVDADMVMDAAAAAPDTSSFHPVHMNHSRVRPNVRRFYRRSERRVSFFAAADIEPGQELLNDYGRAYWYGRQHLELP